ncbi:MAG: hypothetical protein LBK72_05385 [Bifidobacteriaceae bacterium]|jgi:hypothetical protein|nr:hypothetical protein [Bifidobacteriaceae bacterium]
MRFAHKTIGFAAVTAISALGAVAVPVAGVHATTQMAPRAAQTAYTVTLTAPKTATLGDYVTIKAVVKTKANGKRASLVTVQLQRKIVGTSWTTVQADDTDKKGVATFLLPFSSKTQYRAKIAATSTIKGVTSAVRTTQAKGSPTIRALVKSETAKCVKSVQKIAKERAAFSKAHGNDVGKLTDPTAITSRIGEGSPIYGSATGDLDWIKFDIGCGTTYKPDAFLAGNGAYVSIQRKIDGKWTEVLSYQQLMCDQADHKGIPLDLEPVCTLPDGTLRMVQP